MTINVVNSIDLQEKWNPCQEKSMFYVQRQEKYWKFPSRRQTSQINHISNQSYICKSSNSNQNSECIKEILVNDGRTELELETDSLEDDLSNTETPEDAQQIGCVELPKSDSVRNEAIQATVMYVESDDIGDSVMVNICFGDDDELTELHEFESDQFW